MRDVKGLNRTKLTEILRAHYGGSSISIRRIWCGGGTKNLSVVDLGHDGVLDMLLDVGDRKEDENERSETCWKSKVKFLVLIGIPLCLQELFLYAKKKGVLLGWSSVKKKNENETSMGR